VAVVTAAADSPSQAALRLLSHISHAVGDVRTGHDANTSERSTTTI
jgi:hypothetical protein